jgi:hypothetical protein
MNRTSRRELINAIKGQIKRSVGEEADSYPFIYILARNNLPHRNLGIVRY